MIVRVERAGDLAGVYEVNRLAFGRAAEAELVDRLRERGKVLLSLVAVVHERGVGRERVVGHALFTPGAIEGDNGRFACAALGPVAVLPDVQKQGVGTAVIAEGLLRLRASGRERAFVLGHPGYYPRFGFAVASRYGIGNPFGADDAFMVLALRPGGLDGVTGTAVYQPEFMGV